MKDSLYNELKINKNTFKFLQFFILLTFIFKLISKWKFYTRKALFYLMCSGEQDFIYMNLPHNWVKCPFFHLINVHWMWNLSKTTRACISSHSKGNSLFVFCNTITWRLKQNERVTYHFNQFLPMILFWMYQRISEITKEKHCFYAKTHR